MSTREYRRQAKSGVRVTTLNTHAKNLRVQVARDGFDEPEAARDRVARAAHALQVLQHGVHRETQALEIGGGEELVERHVLHERVVVDDLRERALKVRVRVELQRRAEASPLLQDFESERHFVRVAFLLNTLKRALHRQPEVHLLHRAARRRVAIQTRHL